MECTLRELADLVGGVVKGDDSVLIRGVSGLKEAGPDEITFLANPKYETFVNDTRAAAIIMEKERETGKPRQATPGGREPSLCLPRVPPSGP